jgi:hypothetical protein
MMINIYPTSIADMVLTLVLLYLIFKASKFR